MLSLLLPPFYPMHEFFNPEDNQRRQSCELLSKTAARRKKCVEMVSRPSFPPSLKDQTTASARRQRLEIDHSLGNQPLALFSCPKLGKTMAAAVKPQELCSGAHHDVAL